MLRKGIHKQSVGISVDHFHRQLGWLVDQIYRLIKVIKKEERNREKKNRQRTMSKTATTTTTNENTEASEAVCRSFEGFTCPAAS